LALLHAYKHQSIYNEKAVIAISPPTDQVKIFDFSFITQISLGGMLKGYPSAQNEELAAYSPISYIDTNYAFYIFPWHNRHRCSHFTKSDVKPRTN
jgi:hypothetical protein